jgi:hypothetical protein
MVYMTNQLKALGIGEMVPTFTMVLFYYFYTIQLAIGTEYKRHKRLEVEGLDVTMVGTGSKIPIRAEYKPDGLLLDVRPTYMIVYISKEPHYRLPASSWWGICRKDEYNTTLGFRKWVAFGYVSHQLGDVKVYDPNMIGDEVNTFVEFTLVNLQLENTVHAFVVYTEDNEEIRSQIFHPRMSNDFMAVYEWNRTVQIADHPIQSVYKSSTEHEVVVTLGDCTSIDILVTDRILTMYKNTDWETTSTPELYISHGTLSPTTLTFSLFGEPGYYTLVMKDQDLNTLHEQQIFIGKQTFLQ